MKSSILLARHHKNVADYKWQTPFLEQRFTEGDKTERSKFDILEFD